MRKEEDGEGTSGLCTKDGHDTIPTWETAHSLSMRAFILLFLSIGDDNPDSLCLGSLAGGMSGHCKDGLSSP